MVKIRTPSQGHFSVAPQVNVPRSSFNRRHGYKTTFDAGYLIPFYCDEALPGDTFNYKMTALARLATPLHPLMDNLYMDTHFFAVPLRLLWSNFQKFMGEQEDPGDSTDFLVPQIVAPVTTGFINGELSDYLGLPTGCPGISVSSLWHRAYNLIYNEWFRDQNLQQSADVPKTDGPDTVAQFPLRRRGKRYDYFTSCLPWPQKGPAVPLPLTGNAPVRGLGKETATFSAAGVSVYETGQASSQTYPFASPVDFSATNGRWYGQGTAASSGRPNIYADLSQVTATTINALRQAVQVQEYYERDARGGTRYIEKIRAHFGVISPDARLQRPEYLGGGSTPINVSAIAQTSQTTTESPQANLAAVGTAILNNHGFVKSFTEHCIVMGFVSVRADYTYQYGVNRMFKRRTVFDFYWPEFAHLGEQVVTNEEIYAQGTANPTQDAAAFGYQERYAEYRYKPSLITGQFRSNFAQSLDTWHLAEEFTSLPALNSTFIQENPPVDRVIAVESYPHILFDSIAELQCARAMPMYSVPGFVARF